MTTHLDTCETGQEISCPDCVVAGIIQSADCDTCGSARWVHVCDDGAIYSPVTPSADDAVVSIDLDAHAWPFDGLPEYDGAPTCNPSMVQVAETFGVLMADVSYLGWGPWRYRLTGPRANVRRAVAEYWGDDDIDGIMACAEPVTR